MFRKMTLDNYLACLQVCYVVIRTTFGCGFIKDFMHVREMLLIDSLGDKTRAFFQQQECGVESKITK